mgnify:CR=1 FL=1
MGYREISPVQTTVHHTQHIAIKNMFVRYDIPTTVLASFQLHPPQKDKRCQISHPYHNTSTIQDGIQSIQLYQN